MWNCPNDNSSFINLLVLNTSAFSRFIDEWEILYLCFVYMGRETRANCVISGRWNKGIRCEWASVWAGFTIACFWITWILYLIHFSPDLVHSSSTAGSYLQLVKICSPLFSSAACLYVNSPLESPEFREHREASVLFKAGPTECCNSSFSGSSLKVTKSNCILGSVQDRTRSRSATELPLPKISYDSTGRNWFSRNQAHGHEWYI